MKRFVVLTLLGTFLYAQSHHVETRVSVRQEYAELSNDYAPWKSRSIQLQLTGKKRAGLGLGYETLERYDLDDAKKSISAWLHLPLRLVWSGEYATAQKGEIIPETALTNRLSLSLFHGWQVALGRTENRYQSGSRVDMSSSEILTYAGPFRIAYTHYRTVVEDAGTAHSDKVTLHTLYEKGFTAILASQGRELEALPYDRILVTDVSTVSLFGEYRFDRGWGIEYSCEQTKQGDLYLRNGVGLGLVYRF